MSNLSQPSLQGGAAKYSSMPHLADDSVRGVHQDYFKVLVCGILE